MVIYRYNTKKSLGGRSACMSCSQTLSWYELVPLFSFLAQKGRCRNCLTKISWQYPLVEFITGIIFAALFIKFTSIFSESVPIFCITYAYYAVLFALHIIITTYDFRHQIIPDLYAFVLECSRLLDYFYFKILHSIRIFHLFWNYSAV